AGVYVTGRVFALDWWRLLTIPSFLRRNRAGVEEDDEAPVAPRGAPRESTVITPEALDAEDRAAPAPFTPPFAPTGEAPPRRA
ncbi:hypothetical protein ACJENL_27545, partial [Escherichia coli]